jgi:2-amino-4-hydroxy-6-hydroxymethyldihydropteridine diphosphokinase
VAMDVVAYIGVGANLGERESSIATAVQKLSDSAGVKVVRVSALIENPAVGGPVDSPAFLNGAVEVLTSLSAAELLGRLLEIEREIGRVRREKWGPRPIDLDLLLYGDEVIDAPGLTLPHPLMHQRRFVLEPLSQIAPQVVHPLLKRTVGKLLGDLDASH